MDFMNDRYDLMNLMTSVKFTINHVRKHVFYGTGGEMRAQ